MIVTYQDILRQIIAFWHCSRIVARKVQPASRVSTRKTMRSGPPLCLHLPADPRPWHESMKYVEICTDLLREDICGTLRCPNRSHFFGILWSPFAAVVHKADLWGPRQGWSPDMRAISPFASVGPTSFASNKESKRNSSGDTQGVRR